ncbi:hypothetical protein BKA57DRAFT_48620 [Linnemannia elongata]|nr:hypothetical protein BKA57DRAFT_48620 [Linnemannia elongata]
MTVRQYVCTLHFFFSPSCFIRRVDKSIIGLRRHYRDKKNNARQYAKKKKHPIASAFCLVDAIHRHRILFWSSLRAVPYSLLSLIPTTFSILVSARRVQLSFLPVNGYRTPFCVHIDACADALLVLAFLLFLLFIFLCSDSTRHTVLALWPYPSFLLFLLFVVFPFRFITFHFNSAPPLFNHC